MGQQQLLLLIVTMIIIGIATITAINTLESSQVQANHESIKQKMIEAANYAQSYHRKSDMFGGGNGSFVSITLEELNLTADHTLGQFSISDESAESFTLTAIPAAGDEIDIVATIYKDDIQITDVPKE
ncbi:MAG: hypothetical protein CL670_10095 [Balneola sp.]|jgi:Tfp pilus assembly protein PilE|nr:hypothetical protein [Balneola sp.]MBE79493.1 hypothetical protein [Balneola sp.]|tara:strand:- start:178 stop:561 length:384 start_codon:yes stop_codon:yes gene_type:complete